MSHTPRRLGTHIFFAVYLLFALVVLSDAQAQRDTPQLDVLYPVERQAADYIVVLDRSLSMKPYWPATVEALSAFVRAIPDGDHLAFVTFDKRASNSLLIPRVLKPSTRSALLEEMLRLPDPRSTQANDDWNFTNLGAALSKTLDEINRPGANELCFVFLISDFVHDPANDHFTTTDLETTEWKTLVERGELVRRGKAMRSFGLILPFDTRAGRDISIVRAVLGEVPEVRADATTLGAWFERMASEIHREKLGALAQRDVSKGWRFDLGAEGGRTTLKVQSQLEHLRLRVAIDRVILDGQPLPISPSLSASVEPGGVADFPLTVPTIGRGMPWWRWIVTTQQVKTVKSTVSVSGRIAIEPADELVKVGVQPEQVIEASASGFSVRTRAGAPLWLQIAGLAVAIGAGTAVWRVWLRPVPSVGAYARKVIISGSGHTEVLELPRNRKREVVVGNTAGATVLSAVGPPAWAVTLNSRKPRFPTLSPRRGLYVHRSEGQLYHRGRDYDRGAKRWVERDLLLPDSASRALPVGLRTNLIIQHGGDRLQLTFHSK